MPEDGRETWITGIGIVSGLGEGPDAHWQRLNQPPVPPDGTHFAPYLVNRIAPFELDKQIPRKGDQRQMEDWQRIGTYAAGLALDSAGAKGNAELLARMDMIVAAGGGERDEAVDEAILTGLHKATDREAFLNERLMSDLRPTLFLAQLSNLMAGNISIVHGVTGMSRTFMGEESCGVDAVRIAFSRIRAGQSDIALVGGSFNAERKDVLLLFESAGFTLKHKFAPVWERAPLGGGLVPASLGAFIVIESAEHAKERGGKPLARLAGVQSARAKRRPGSIVESLNRMWQPWSDQVHPGRAAVISGATGAEPATSEERTWLTTAVPALPARATGTHLGHAAEPQFVMNVALATVALRHRKLFAPASAPCEAAMHEALAQVVVTAVGAWRGEGMALVEAAP
ncbi:MAG: beta-ketoacyl-ACP synthase [Hyphomicrobiales bacterium]|nr:beta-ketoacyl-ACP synthase [Hyphomicrobiales bacterium]